MTHKHRLPEEFEADIDARQRNAVFPDTARNEAKFWRNVISGEQKLSWVLVVGFVLVASALVVLLGNDIRLELHGRTDNGSFGEMIFRHFGGQLLALAVVAIFLLVLKFATRPTHPDKS